MGVEPFLITSSVVCIINQRLVRKICESCKEAYPLSDAMYETLGIAKGKNSVMAYRGKGCKKCFNIGYLGRIVLGEVLTLSPAVKELILRKQLERTQQQPQHQLCPNKNFLEAGFKRARLLSLKGLIK